MATAEQLLHEAQYAFHSISFGESRENRRNRRRATSLCKKIIRRFPASVEASEAHAILRRLGEEAYISRMRVVHRHDTVHRIPTETTAIVRSTADGDDDTVPLDWGGLMSLLFRLPKTIMGVIVFVGVVLFGIFGYLLFLPLVVLIMFTGPFRGFLKPVQRRQLNDVVMATNAWIDGRHRPS